MATISVEIPDDDLNKIKVGESVFNSITAAVKSFPDTQANREEFDNAIAAWGGRLLQKADVASADCATAQGKVAGLESQVAELTQQKADTEASSQAQIAVLQEEIRVLKLPPVDAQKEALARAKAEAEAKAAELAAQLEALENGGS